MKNAHCGHCKAENPADFSFCFACRCPSGKHAAPAAAKPSGAAKKKKKKT